MTPTITNLAKHIGRSRNALYHMKQANPKQFALLWAGWVKYCEKD